MTVKDLSKEQRTELKCNYYCNVLHEGEDVSYGELAEIDDLVNDEVIDDYYFGIDFVNDDFCCSVESDRKTLQDNDTYKHNLTIEDMFISVGVKNVFDEDGYFTPEAEKVYDKVGEKFFDNIDDFDKLCREEKCFRYEEF